jgi:hypothetical protein
MQEKNLIVESCLSEIARISALVRANFAATVVMRQALVKISETPDPVRAGNLRMIARAALEEANSVDIDTAEVITAAHPSGPSGAKPRLPVGSMEILDEPPVAAGAAFAAAA